jgi:hypothetical protein
MGLQAAPKIDWSARPMSNGTISSPEAAATVARLMGAL